MGSQDDFHRTTETGQGAKLNEEDVKGLIKAQLQFSAESRTVLTFFQVMNHIQDMYKNEAELIRLQDLGAFFLNAMGVESHSLLLKLGTV